MSKAILTALRQTINIRTLLGIIATIILVFLSSTETLLRLFPVTSLQSYGYHTSFVQNAIFSDTLAASIPILAVLPFAACNIDDIKSKFVRFILIRTNYVTYLVSHILVCFFSGGYVVVIGAMLAWGVSALLFRPIEETAGISLELTTLFLRTCELLFLNGGLWAIFGMTMSTIMESKYIAYASPFVMYYLLIILHERYLQSVWILSPKNWFNPEIWPYGIGCAVGFILELAILLGWVSYFRWKRRLETL